MNIRRIIIIGFIALVALIVGIFIFIQANPSGTLVVAVAPEEGTLVLDGKERKVKNEDKIGLSIGEHTVAFKRDEFKDSETKKVTITKDENMRVIFVLEPLTDAARALLQTEGAQRVREQNGGQEIINASNEAVDKNPILTILPIQSRLYTVSACQSEKFPNDPDKVALCVNSSGEYDLLPYVRKDISSKGYNPDDFEIIFVNKFEDEDHGGE